MTDKQKRKTGRPRKDDSQALSKIADEKLQDPSLSIMKAARVAGIPIEEMAREGGTEVDSVRKRLERGFKRDEPILMKEAKDREQQRSHRTVASVKINRGSSSSLHDLGVSSPFSLFQNSGILAAVRECQRIENIFNPIPAVTILECLKAQTVLAPLSNLPHLMQLPHIR